MIDKLKAIIGKLILSLLLISCDRHKCVQYEIVEVVKYHCLNPLDELNLKAEFNIMCTKEIVKERQCVKFKKVENKCNNHH